MLCGRAIKKQVVEAQRTTGCGGEERAVYRTRAGEHIDGVQLGWNIVPMSVRRFLREGFFVSMEVQVFRVCWYR